MFELLPALSMFGQVGGLAQSVFGNYFSAKAQQSQLRAQAMVADTNARLAELGAQSALAQGNQQAAAASAKYGQVKSAQRAAMAANGIDLGVGSAAEVQASTDLAKEQDMNTIAANATRSAWGYREQATDYTNQAAMARAGAASINPSQAAFSTLLSGAGKVASHWYQLKKAGAFDGAGDDPIYTMAKKRGWFAES